MSEVVWHDVECGGYDADLPLWEELAAERPGSVLDLGCGTGRVALHLARRGHPVTALDWDATMLATLEERTGALPIATVNADARSFALADRFSLILAPMQLLQTFSAPLERKECLGCIAAHLAPDGLAAVAIVDELPQADDVSPPLPDTREVDGWVYSSQPLETIPGPLEIRVRRLRQTVSPSGKLSEEIDEVQLRPLTVTKVENEAAPVMLSGAGVRSVAESEQYADSTVVLLERES
jgi:SAM-dependent methyltransferase